MIGPLAWRAQLRRRAYWSAGDKAMMGVLGAGVVLGLGGWAMRGRAIEALEQRQVVWDVVCAEQLVLPAADLDGDRLVSLAVEVRSHGPADRLEICGAPPWVPPEG